MAQLILMSCVVVSTSRKPQMSLRFASANSYQSTKKSDQLRRSKTLQAMATVIVRGTRFVLQRPPAPANDPRRTDFMPQYGEHLNNDQHTVSGAGVVSTYAGAQPFDYVHEPTRGQRRRCRVSGICWLLLAMTAVTLIAIVAVTVYGVLHISQEKASQDAPTTFATTARPSPPFRTTSTRAVDAGDHGNTTPCSDSTARIAGPTSLTMTSLVSIATRDENQD